MSCQKGESHSFISHGYTLMTPTQVAKQLSRTGLCVSKNYLSPLFLNKIQKDIDTLKVTGLFSRAGIGQGKNRIIQDLIRSDEVSWLDRKTATATQTKLWHKIDLLKKAFNRTLFLGLQDFEGHYASYSAGGFYKRHLDSPPHNNKRLVSLILYLNENWKTTDGGCLRIFGQNTFTDIEPVGGTLVCFLSEDSEHEVLPSQGPRLSFTGWFKK